MGRTSLILVVGFNIIFITMGLNISSISSHAYNSYINDINHEQAHFAAESVVNIALADLYAASTANTFYTMPGTNIAANTYQNTINFNGATATITQFRDLTLLRNTFTVVSNYQGYIDTVIILSRQQNFAQFAMYTVNDGGIIWGAGEFCNGPLHSEGTLTLQTADGHANGNNGNGPQFTGRVTVKGGYTLNGTANPAALYNGFTGGYQNGVGIAMPSAAMLTTNLTTSLPKAINLAPTAGKDIYIDFLSNSTMLITQSAANTQNTDQQWVNNANYTPYTTAGNGSLPGNSKGIYSTLTSANFNGVIALTGASNANIHIRGKLDGAITIANVAGTGSVYIDSSVTYLNGNVNNPAAPPLSNDMLGIVANHSVIITDNPNNNVTTAGNLNPAGDVNIDATIFSLGLNNADGFTAQNYKTRNAGYINLLGGLQQNNRQAVGQTSGSGFQKNYTYDKRYLNSFPPGYPVTQLFGLVTYYENMQWPDGIWSIW
jgi:hypothetical protein